jgi:hypothetical protein
MPHFFSSSISTHPSSSCIKTNATLIFPLSAVAEPSNYEEKQTYVLLFHLIKHLHEVYTKNSPNSGSIKNTDEIQFAESLVLTLKFGIDHELYSNGKQTAPLPLKERLSLVKARIASNAIEFPGPWEILTAKHIQRDDRAELPLKMGGTVCGSKL